MSDWTVLLTDRLMVRLIRLRIGYITRKTKSRIYSWINSQTDTNDQSDVQNDCRLTVRVKVGFTYSHQSHSYNI